MVKKYRVNKIRLLIILGVSSIGITTADTSTRWRSSDSKHTSSNVPKKATGKVPNNRRTKFVAPRTEVKTSNPAVKKNTNTAPPVKAQRRLTPKPPVAPPVTPPPKPLVPVTINFVTIAQERSSLDVFKSDTVSEVKKKLRTKILPGNTEDILELYLLDRKLYGSELIEELQVETQDLTIMTQKPLVTFHKEHLEILEKIKTALMEKQTIQNMDQQSRIKDKPKVSRALNLVNELITSFTGHEIEPIDIHSAKQTEFNHVAGLTTIEIEKKILEITTKILIRRSFYIKDNTNIYDQDDLAGSDEMSWRLQNKTSIFLKSNKKNGTQLTFVLKNPSAPDYDESADCLALRIPELKIDFPNSDVLEYFLARKQQND